MKGQLYTHGLWKVIPGREEEFTAAWAEFARWMAANVPGVGKGLLLRDLREPGRFVSLGPWDSIEAIEAWRGLPEFQQFVARVQGLTESFQPATLEVVAESPG